MMSSRLAVCASLMLVSFSSFVTTVIYAFAPPTSHLHRGRIANVAGNSPAFAASLQEDKTLPDDDEDVLFGSSSVKHKGRILNASSSGASRKPLDQSLDPLVNKLSTMRKTVTSCPAIWKELAANCPDKRALLDEHLCDKKIDYTFKKMEDQVRRSAAAFKNLGVKKGVNVAVLGENSAMWLIVDHGIQLAGGASAVRGADAPVDELRYIYEHSDSAGIAVLQDVKLLQTLARDAKAKGLGALGLRNDSFGPLKTVVLMHRGTTSDDEIEALGVDNGVKVKVLSDLLESTSPVNYSDLPDIGKSDLSTSECLCVWVTFLLVLFHSHTEYLRIPNIA